MENNNIPNDRLFTEEHEWVKINGEQALIGITNHAQHALGDVVYLELPEPGTKLNKGSALGVVESVKAVSDIYAPLSGEVLAVNKTAVDKPELINNDPYGEAWLLSIKISNIKEQEQLLNKEQYQALLEREVK